MEKEKEDNNHKDIEVVSGNGENLDISPVSTHLPICNPKSEKQDEKKIIIPEEKKKRRRQ